MLEFVQYLPPIVGNILSSYVPCISSNMSAIPMVLPEYFWACVIISSMFIESDGRGMELGREGFPLLVLDGV